MTPGERERVVLLLVLSFPLLAAGTIAVVRDPGREYNGRPWR